ncbi:MAG: hypothetical protein GF333_00045 [Candidatus Omnitrophica bacterium]|nr:hypothetical protein [Candidatus Omnitrophota bacterium]
MAWPEIKTQLNALPHRSGVYLIKGRRGRVLYVGKAASLRSRVKNHFSPSSPRGELFRTNAEKIEHIECESPEQALLLEAALIQEKKPKYNIALRDDKSYPYVEITREKFPRIFVSRPKGETNSALYGPYTKAKPLKDALTMIRRVIPFCSCKGNPKATCLFFHLGLCPAPCAGRISVKEYRENIRKIEKILKGKRQVLLHQLRGKMRKLSQQKKFEEAGKVRDEIVAIENLYQGKPAAHELMALKKSLRLPKLPLRIEAFDISNFTGKEATGSMVCFRGGIPDKNEYRRFKIRQKEKIDDYAMMGEIVRRRYRRVRDEALPLPDLVVIDGGAGHVHCARQVIEELGLDLPLVGIAKKKEEIWFPPQSQYGPEGNPVVLAESDPGLQLIQRVRDEAHRFARKYHILLRRKNMRGKERE